jgi:hypothetical protein
MKADVACPTLSPKPLKELLIGFELAEGFAPPPLSLGNYFHDNASL